MARPKPHRQSSELTEQNEILDDDQRLKAPEHGPPAIGVYFESRGASVESLYSDHSGPPSHEDGLFHVGGVGDSARLAHGLRGLHRADLHPEDDHNYAD